MLPPICCICNGRLDPTIIHFKETKEGFEFEREDLCGMNPDKEWFCKECSSHVKKYAKKITLKQLLHNLKKQR